MYHYYYSYSYSAYHAERGAMIAIHDVRLEFFGKASHASGNYYFSSLYFGLQLFFFVIADLPI